MGEPSLEDAGTTVEESTMKLFANVPAGCREQPPAAVNPSLLLLCQGFSSCFHHGWDQTMQGRARLVTGAGEK